VVGIDCPVLVIQGENDSYGTLEQLKRIETAINTETKILLSEECEHSPHSEKPDEIFQAVLEFVDKITEPVS